MVTTGSYSDYTVNGVFVALEDCNLPLLATDYSLIKSMEAKCDPNRSSYWDIAKTSDFPAWLIEAGLCEALDVPSVHLGDGETNDWPINWEVPYVERHYEE